MKATPRKLAIPVLAVLGFLLVPRILMAQTRAIDTGHSEVRVYVSKAGLLSALGDNHVVEALISEGLVDEVARNVKFVIDSRRVRVLDPQLSPDTRKQVQERMLGPDVLDVARFPEIRFESTGVEQTGPDRLLVRGQLSLHGQTHSVVVSVRTENGHYVGTSSFKQRDFGITPVTIAGGTVKVKDEVKIEFDIRTNAQAAGVMSK